MRRAVALAAALLVAVPALAASAAADPVRVFALGPRVSPDWIDTREHYRAKLLALADARERGRPGVPPVADGAGDVASHRLGGGRDLVTLPEDVGLIAAFTGERGTAARAATSLVDAIVALIGAYGPVSEHYARRFPELTRRPLPTRLLVVSMTDTFARTAVETFAELADRLDATLVAGVNMARDWRVVCVSKATFRPPPGAERCDVEDPALVAALRAPDEPQRDYAYEATTPDAVNMALVFGPDGRIVARQVKTYLTPLELPSQLDLRPGPVSGLTAVDTPAGRIGVVISKDAWMPDVLDRLDADGVRLLVQPEFFVGDTVAATGMWAPDNLKASGYADVLRHPSFTALGLPSMTGQVFDVAADAQSHVAVKPRTAGAGPAGRLVGQDPAPGFAAVQPWSVPDPLGEPVVARRERLAAAGGGPVEGTVFADVELPPQRSSGPLRARATGPFSAARALSRGRGEQRHVTLAAHGRRVVAAWSERAGSAWRVKVARSADAGRTWSAPRDLGPGQRPALAAGARGHVWLAVQRAGRVRVAHSRDGGRRFGPARPVPGGGAPQWRPAIAATGAGRAYVAWIDERGRQREGDLPRAAVWGARVEGARVGRARELDPYPPVSDLAAQLDNDWAVAVGARGRHVTVAWTDFRTYDWRIVGRSSRDGGRRFGPLRAISDDPADREALDDAPSVAVGRDGAPLVAWTGHRAAATIAPAPLYDVRLARVGRASRRVDDGGDRPVVSVNPALALDPRDGAPLVAWQDHADGVGAIRVAARGRVRRVSASAANQWRPAVAVAGGRLLVAWEDARGGAGRAVVAAAPLRRLR
ncbi:MAG: hypothetical protein IRZ32_09990 [Solirubrobacteraceae bacterium]|nr:hypothetical protein [Solirubrobacteraceae bacterium]